MTEKQALYITTPIYYVNDVPHLGHAYTTLACDVVARFRRLQGWDVKFLTGTDEHGQKVAKSAAAKEMSPLAFCDIVSQNFRELCDTMQFTNDDFIRTTEERHRQACVALWNRLVETGDIYLGAYKGWYALRDEAYYGEDELTTLPNGSKIAPSGAEVEWVEEPSYFFRLSAWGDRILAHISENPDFIQPVGRRNEVVSFIKSGLQDLSVSRTAFDWGVKVPGNPEHVMYVWLDALTNYLTAVGYPDTDSEKFRHFWPQAVHVVGKDIVRFHAVYWPAFLLAAGLPLPHKIFAHGWWTVEGAKMSKSLGNVVAPRGLIENYGLDQTRYFLLRDVPFGQDGDFSHKSMVQRINSELANNLGNLVQRTLSMIAKNCAGKIPAPQDFNAEDKALLIQANAVLEIVNQYLDNLSFHRALESIWELSSAANVYIDTQAPWGLKKTDPTRMATVLYVLAETIRHLGLILLAFMPDSAGKILDQLAIETVRDFSMWKNPLVPGVELPMPQGIFPRHIEENAA